MSEPRLAPLRPEEMADDQRELVGLLPPLNIFATLVRHPGLFRRWMPFGGKLLQGAKLAERDRELVILRTAWRCHCRYEWAQHVAIARTAGLSDDEIRAVASGASASWPEREAALLRAVDELLDDHVVADATWAALSEALTEQQLIEVPLLCGHYAMLAGFLNSAGVQPERDDLPALGDA